MDVLDRVRRLLPIAFLSRGEETPLTVSCHASSCDRSFRPFRAQPFLLKLRAVFPPTSRLVSRTRSLFRLSQDSPRGCRRPLACDPEGDRRKILALVGPLKAGQSRCTRYA